MTIRPVREDELDAAARSASVAFVVPVEDCLKWFATSGVEHLRALDEGGVATAFLLYVPMGQFVLGGSLPMMGIAGVTVPPELRGRGRGRALMDDAIRAMYADGFVLSSLYPSTQTLYRAVGYEQCGAMFEHRVPRAEFIGLRAGSFDVRVVPAEDPSVRALYRQFASRNNGYLDRGPYVWNRVAQHRGDKFECLGCYREDGTLAAYASLAQVRDGGEVLLKVRDFAYADGEGARAVLALIDRFTTVSEAALLYGGPVLPILSLLPQEKFETRRVEYTMSRVVNVERALAERRYPAGLRASFALSVRDSLIAENNGTFALEIDEGRALVRRVAHAEASATMDVRSLAPLFMGWSSATTLLSVGAIGADGGALGAIDAAFAAGPSSLCDYF
jgi:predicted acetyltransferase